MTDRWADYLISAVRHDSDGGHIEEVQVRKDEGEKVGSPSTWRRSDVVAGLEGAYTFMTIVMNPAGRWDPGAEVAIVTAEGAQYIRTDADGTAEDNLGSLPTF